MFISTAICWISSRADVTRQVPMHEFSVHPDTGLYSLSVLTGELQPSAQPGQPWDGSEKKVFVSGKDLYRPKMTGF